MRTVFGLGLVYAAWGLQGPAPQPQRAGLKAAHGSMELVDVALTAASSEEWLSKMEAISALPKGFKTAVTKLTFEPAELQGSVAKMNIAAIVLDEPSADVAAVYTRNALCGAPVSIGRRRMAGGGAIGGIVINNKVSNVRPKGGGEDAAEAVCAAVAERFGISGGANAVLPASTGVIGWGLPAAAMCDAVATMDVSTTDSILGVAQAMMTTDRYAKVARYTLPSGDTIVGIAKGAGMIEPNLATMLSFVLTDAKIGRAELQACLQRVVQRTYNSMGIDGDESTSDMVVCLSSGAGSAAAAAAFEEGLGAVCAQLAHHIVRNGEGTNHVVRVTVRGDSRDERAARELGRAILNGPLLKCAIAGNDPNVGRLVGKLGQVLGARGDSMPEKCVVKIAGEVIFKDGEFDLDPAKEKALSAHFKQAQLTDEAIGLPGNGGGDRFPVHARCVEIEIDLGGDPQICATVLGSDLTYQYVKENADYRS
ncbi:arginine biosynthesis protein ArgJ [Pelagophyceae sp. CCMP2097]|nr:arginine biosynthesis protein ArgJ [Pelagophyceae sp. CCMP2097]